jgi:glycosyltransferase involved in cell wall biosynthesis
MEYFESQLAPHIDGERVEYLGPVDDEAKNALLSSSAALLMPIEWEEPFGIVMAEAMACGTPIVGFARGSVNEVVRDGVDGFVCSGNTEAVSAVGRLGAIDRRAVRLGCEQRFSSTVVVDEYERLYTSLCAEGHGGGAR